MSDIPSTIKDFLIGLGFDIDKNSEKEFTKAIKGATLEANIMADVIEDVAKRVIAAVGNMAKEYDELYWASKRLGSSAGDIKGFEYGLSQLGGTAAGARSALESVAEFMRSNPGSGGFLQSLGVSPKDLGNSVKVLDDLEARFKKMPYYQAKVYASVLGIDPLTLQAMLRDNGQYSKEYAEFVGKLGLNLDQAAKSSNEFMTRMREFKAEGGLLFAVFGNDVLERILPELDKFSKWLTDISGNKALHTFALDSKDAADSVEKLIEQLGKMGVGDAFKNLGGGIFDWLDKQMKALGHLVRAMTAVLRGDWKTAGSEIAGYGHDMVSSYGAIAKSEVRAVESLHTAPGGSSSKGSAKDNMAEDWFPSSHATKSSAARSILDFFMKNGASMQSAMGITAGIFAETAGTLSSDATNPKSGAYGLGQWLGKRKSDLLKMFGPHPTFDQQLMFLLYEMQHGEAGHSAGFLSAGTASGALSHYIKDFMRPGNGYGIDMASGLGFLRNSGPLMSQSGGVTLNQQTQVHMHGSAASAGPSVVDKQADINARLVRDLKSTVN